MRLVVAVALVFAAKPAWTSTADSAARSVNICVERGGDGPTIEIAEALASKMFSDIQVTVMWRPARSCGSSPGGIVISYSETTPEKLMPGALAYALPYQGDRIVVFYDRVRAVRERPLLPRLLAHVLVHEITHILQGVVRHSETGVMKARFNEGDYFEMGRKPLAFTAADVNLIYQGMEVRRHRPPRSASR